MLDFKPPGEYSWLLGVTHQAHKQSLSAMSRDWIGTVRVLLVYLLSIFNAVFGLVQSSVCVSVCMIDACVSEMCPCSALFCYYLYYSFLSCGWGSFLRVCPLTAKVSVV